MLIIYWRNPSEKPVNIEMPVYKIEQDACAKMTLQPQWTLFVTWPAKTGHICS